MTGTVLTITGIGAGAISVMPFVVLLIGLLLVIKCS